MTETSPEEVPFSFSSNSTNDLTEQEVIVRTDVSENTPDEMSGLPVGKKIYAVANSKGHCHVD